MTIEEMERRMTYQERVAAYERQKKVAHLVCKTPEEYEAMVKQLVKIWRI